MLLLLAHARCQRNHPCFWTVWVTCITSVGWPGVVVLAVSYVRRTSLLATLLRRVRQLPSTGATRWRRLAALTKIFFATLKMSTWVFV